jgi:phage major head subunit gpT-like protein
MANPVFAPQELRKDVRGEFIEAEMEPRPAYLWERIATTIPSTSDRENYAFLSSPASMTEITDEMPINSLTDFDGVTARTGNEGPGYEVVNKTYGGALLFKRDDMDDAKVGGFRIRIQDQANVANAHPDEELMTQLTTGTTCYINGEDFFSATHAARGEQTAGYTWSNSLTGTGTTVAQLQADIASALTAFYKMRNTGNRYMNRHVKSFYILCPVALEVNMRTAVYAAIVSSTSNVGFKPNIEVISEPSLDADDANDWYFGSLDGGIRGLIWQNRRGIELEEIGPGTETWVNLRQMEFAVTRRGAPAFGYPERLIKVSNT